MEEQDSLGTKKRINFTNVVDESRRAVKKSIMSNIVHYQTSNTNSGERKEK